MLGEVRQVTLKEQHLDLYRYLDILKWKTVLGKNK